MRKTKAETAESRKRIIEAAISEFRKNGIDGTGVAEIMAAAGMTHGGFYRHFASKDQLVAEACDTSMQSRVEAAQQASRDGDDSYLDHVLEYLSKDFHDNYAGGCALVSMGSELARATPEARHAATEGFRGLVDVTAQRNGGPDPMAARANAIFTLTSMIGALTMARVVDDPELSDWILDIAKERLVDATADSGAAQSKQRRAGVTTG